MQLIACPNPHACRNINCAPLSETGSASTRLIRLTCSTVCNTTDPSPFSCFCHEGYTDRLCSRCQCESAENCYYSRNSEEFECAKCGPTSAPVLIAVTVFLVISQIIFLLFKRSALAVLLAEFVVMALLLFFGLAESYVFNMVVATGLLFLVNSASSDSGSQSALPTSAVKILIFFVPTTFRVVPSSVWPEFAKNIMRKIDEFSLRVSGLECIAPDWLGKPQGRFLFIMLVPFLFGALVVLGSVLAHLLGRLAFVQRMQKWRCQCGKKSETWNRRVVGIRERRRSLAPCDRKV